MGIQERNLGQLQLRDQLRLPVQPAEHPRLLWAALYKWPGEIKDGNGKRQIDIVDSN